MYEEFYEKQYSKTEYAHALKMEQHSFYKVLSGYVSKYDENILEKKK